MNRIKQILQFFKVDIWRSMTTGSNKTHAIWNSIIKAFVLSIRLCFNRRVTVQASALTYYTFFATIPTLAFIYAIGRGFGMDDAIKSFFVRAFSAYTNVSAINMLFSMIESYLDHAKGGVFVGIGIIFLCWSVYNVFTQVEKSLNEIWGVGKNRSFIRRFTDYFSLTLLIPFIIIISSGLNLYLRFKLSIPENSKVLSPTLQFLMFIKPWFLCFLVCTLAYQILPNTKVKFLSAMMSGFLASVFIILFKDLYVYFIKWATSYNVVYGSLAAIPVLMLFLRILWTIILCGAEISFASQQFKMFEYRDDVKQISPRYRFYVTLVILRIIVKNFEDGVEPPLSAAEISKKYKIPLSLINLILPELCQCRVILESKIETGKQECIVFSPAMDPNKITVGTVYKRLQKNGSSGFLPEPEAGGEEDSEIQRRRHIMEIVDESNEKFEMAHQNILIKDL